MYKPIVFISAIQKSTDSEKVHTFLYLVYGAEHASLQLQEPFLHLPTSFRCRDDIQQLHHLSFAAPHMSDVQNVSEHDISNTLKTLFQVGLHPGT